MKLHTLVIYREDAQTLYGFATTAERDFFRLMIENVTGVGPKMALSIMSRLSLPLLENAIRVGDVGTLAKCPGIGKKTAERLVVELRSPRSAPTDRRPLCGADGEASAAPRRADTHRDAVAALDCARLQGRRRRPGGAARRARARRQGLDRGPDQESAELSLSASALEGERIRLASRPGAGPGQNRADWFSAWPGCQSEANRPGLGEPTKAAAIRSS